MKGGGEEVGETVGDRGGLKGKETSGCEMLLIRYCCPPLCTELSYDNGVASTEMVRHCFPVWQSF